MGILLYCISCLISLLIFPKFTFVHPDYANVTAHIQEPSTQAVTSPSGQKIKVIANSYILAHKQEFTNACRNVTYQPLKQPYPVSFVSFSAFAVAVATTPSITAPFICQAC